MLVGGAGASACLFSPRITTPSPHLLIKVPDYRRRLPHFHPNHRYLFLTWRLWHSLPSHLTKPAANLTPGQSFVTTDRLLDSQTSGPLWLQDHRIADLVCTAILHGERSRRFYDLSAWVIMPNHIHLVILPLVPVPVLMRWLKGSTARAANQLLGRTGQPFWQDESFDHYLRNLVELEHTIAYVEENPVSAGLVSFSKHWHWSSAGLQPSEPRTL